MSMPAGWYDDPFTDHLQRQWNGESWTKETRPRPEFDPTPVAPSPGVAAPGTDAPVRDYLVLSILALIFCAWPLAIPAVYFSVKANAAKKQGDMAKASTLAGKARLFLILSAAIGVVVGIYLAYVLLTADVPIDQGTLTPLGN